MSEDLIDGFGAIAALLDGSGRIIETNEAWRLFSRLNDGRSADTGCGVNYLQVCDLAARRGDRHAEAVARGVRDVLGGTSERFDLEYPCPSPVEDRWFEVRVASSTGAGVARAAVVSHHDVTARAVVSRRLAALTDDDVVAGLASGRCAVRHLRERLAWAAETGGLVGVVVLDLRGIDELGERHGSRIRDDVFVKVASRARRALRAEDHLYRLGASELVLVVDGLGRVAMVHLAARLRGAMAVPFQVGELALAAEVGVGWEVATVGATVESLVGAAGATIGVDPERLARAVVVAVGLDAAVATVSSTAAAKGSETSGGSLLPPVGHFVSELAAVRARVSAADAQTSDLVIFFDGDGTIRSVGPASAQLFGVEPSELIGRNGLDLIHPDDQERVFLEFASMTGLGASVRTQFRVIGASGAVSWLEEVVTDLLDDPSIGAVVGNLHDISDRVRAEEAVRFQAGLLAAVGHAVIANDLDGLVTYWNGAAESLYGWSSSEAVGRHIASLTRVEHPRPGMLDEIDGRLGAGRRWFGELRVQTRAGSVVPVSVSITPIYDDAGRRVGAIAASSDISARLRADQATALLAAVVQSSADAIFSADTAGLVTSWNTGASLLFGRTAEEMTGRHVSTIVPTTAVLEGGTDLFALALAGRSADAVDARAMHADGSEVDVSISVAPISSTSGAIVGTCTIARDIGERLALLRTIEADRARLAAAQESASLGSFEWDLRTDELTLSDELWRLLGLGPQPHEGVGLADVRRDDRATVAGLMADVRGGDDTATYRFVRADGAVRWLHARTDRVRCAATDKLVGTLQDITERHVAALALEHQATHDWLTDLPNTASLHASLQRILDGAAPGRWAAVAVVDLDHLKTVNNRVGHATGDLVMRAVADRLSTGLRADDVVARMDGDQFVVVRPDVATTDDAWMFASDVFARFAAPISIGERDLAVTASVGAALSTTSDSPMTLLRDASDAMYQAKRNGRNQIVVFDVAARLRAERIQAISSALPSAVAGGELHVEFQPIIDIRSTRVAGFEALVRWEDLALGTVRPDELIPVAESTGLILTIGAWVLDEALRQLAVWRSDPRVDPDLWMSINVSAAQLAQPGLVEHVIGAVERAGVPAAAVHLEITESMLMESVDDARHALAELQAAGVRISIDDFGTGYSSLSYLARLAVDTIKIDRAFVNELDGAGPDLSIVQTILLLAQTLQLDVVAEGIERPAQLAVLARLGCTYGQGFIWSPSMRADAALTWMLAPIRPDDPGSGER